MYTSVKNSQFLHECAWYSLRSTCQIDPGVVIEMERRAQTVAAELSHVMGNLRNSLHAVSYVCLLMKIA